MELQCLLINAIILFCLSLQGQTYQDCTHPYPICDLTTYHFEEMAGYGQFYDKLPELRCTSNQKLKESNSKWLFLEIKKSGTLVWSIEAMDKESDLDFSLFKMKEDCTDLEEVTCLGSVQSGINMKNTKPGAKGNPGLNLSSLDDFGNLGYQYSDKFFLKFLSVKQDEKYVFLINNSSSTSGFSISFDGNCELREAHNCANAELRFSISDLCLNLPGDTIIVHFHSISDTYTFQILDTMGKVFKEENGKSKAGFQTLSTHIGPLSTGIYVLRIVQSKLKASGIFVKED